MGQAFALPRYDRNDGKKIILKKDARGFPVLEEISDVPARGGVGVEDAQGTFDEMPGDGDIAQTGIGQGGESGLAQVQIVRSGAGRAAIHHLDDNAGAACRVVGLDTGAAGT
jgi:hypothetical protein